MKLSAAIVCIGLMGTAMAQVSSSYRLTGAAFPEGGNPEAGTVLVSTSFRISLDAVGDTAFAPLLASASYAIESGFVAGYPPPGEVRALGFAADRSTISWQADRSTGVYHVYRGELSDLPGTYGVCRLAGVSGETALVSEIPLAPPLQSGLFYLVTAENRLGEEGTKGSDGGGVARTNPVPCP